MGFLFTGDDELRTMNRTWRGRDRATDVLSFPAEPDTDGPAGRLSADGTADTYIGDIAISLDRARVQAPRFSATFEEETARLVVHGLLHLLGYDHHTPADGRKMKARERVYLAGVEPGALLRPC